MRPQTTRYLSAREIGTWFDVQAATVRAWVYRHDFPAPDVEIPHGSDGGMVLGWHPERETEIRAWHANRISGGKAGRPSSRQ